VSVCWVYPVTPWSDQAALASAMLVTVPPDMKGRNRAPT
jgi:hypothetical protein